MEKRKNKAIFLDRDGIINIDKGYVHKIEDFHFTDDIFKVLKHFMQKGFKLVIVTNQSGIAREYYTEEDYEKVTNYMLKELEKNQIKIEKIYYCPHHENGSHKTYSIKCECRKPESGMIKAAIKEFNIDPNKSYIIGDKESDIEAGLKENLTAILISKEQNIQTKAHHSFKNISETLKII